MDELAFSRDLRRRGHSADEIARMVRSGALTRIRRGAYRVGPTDDEQDIRLTHRRLVEATLKQCGTDLIVSHQSAAALHGLPVWRSRLTRVELTRCWSGRGSSRHLVQIHGLSLTPEEVVVVDGIAVTSLARTVLDLACQLPMQEAVAVGDAALRMGLAQGDLRTLLERAARRHGIGAARRCIAFLDRRSESVGESRSRVIFHEHGLPVPELQFKVVDHEGWTFAETDFGWPELRTVGEYDGKVKYQRSLRPGHDPEKELWSEKRREDRIRDNGFEVVRWVSAELHDVPGLLDRLRRAFVRGSR